MRTRTFPFGGRLFYSVVVVALICAIAHNANAQQSRTRAEPTAPVDTAKEVAPRTLADAEAAGMTLLGVYDNADGHWIQGATIRDTLGGETVTSRIGVAALNALTPIAGYYMVEIRTPGYAPRHLRLRADTSAEILAGLDPNPLGQGVMIAPVVVTASRRLAEDEGLHSGFVNRCQSGLITCVGRAELDRDSTGGLAMYLRHVAGIHDDCAGSHCSVQMLPLGGPALGCTPKYFLNGLPLPGGQGQIDKLLTASNIEGIEVYLASSPRPARFDAIITRADVLGGKCGSIVIWTR